MSVISKALKVVDAATLSNPADIQQHGEASPLLDGLEPNHALEDNSSANGVVGQQMSMPKSQLLLLCYIRVLDPISFFSIFPFIAKMVKHNGHLADTDVGFYSGFMESLFSIAQMLVLVYWGRLADRIGRKPVLMISLTGTMFLPAMFGMTTSLLQMGAVRFISGAFTASNLLIRTMIGDRTATKDQAVAYSWLSFSSNIGIFVGPVIGGILAEPATQYPNIFGGIWFFEKYPYVLPGLAVSVMSIVGLVLAIVNLEETLEPRTHHQDSCSGQSEQQRSSSRRSIASILQFPGVVAALAMYAQVMALAYCETAILPVALFTPVRYGGIGLSISQSSVFLAVQGASQAVWMIVAFPPLHRRFGNKKVVTACAIGFPLLFLANIAVNVFLRQGTQTTLVWALIAGGFAALLGPAVTLSFTASQLILNDVSPEQQVLGTLNAIALTIISGVRAVAPGSITALYAIGVQKQILWGHLAWIVLIFTSFGLIVTLRGIHEVKKPRQSDQQD